MRVKLKSVVLVTFSLLCGGALYVVVFLSTDLHVHTDREGYVVLQEDPAATEAWSDSEKKQERRGPMVPRPQRQLRDVLPTGSLLEVQEPFHFPQPQFSLPDRELLQSDWVTSLKVFLSGVKGKQISMVTSTQEHVGVLINWLISAYIVADPPLENVLVLSLGERLHELLVSRGISSLLVTPEMVIHPDAGIDTPFSQVHIIRLTVLRLIVHFGLSVVNYDCDAIILRNPQLVFDKYGDADIIGTFGKGPQHLFTRWGVTLNTGVLLFRSNPKVEHYWEFMSRLSNPTTDDQGNVNLALEELRIQWMNLRPDTDIDTFNHEIYGICMQNKIIVVLLPFNIICRHTCTANRRNRYYVWHALAIKENRTVENKKGQAQVGRAWFLRDDWEHRTEGITGLDWLKSVTSMRMVRK